jgi:hypothetical protein
LENLSLKYQFLPIWVKRQRIILLKTDKREDLLVEVVVEEVEAETTHATLNLDKVDQNEDQKEIDQNSKVKVDLYKIIYKPERAYFIFTSL